MFESSMYISETVVYVQKRVCWEESCVWTDMVHMYVSEYLYNVLVFYTVNDVICYEQFM